MGKIYTAGEVLTAADLNASLNEAVNTTGFFTFTGAHVHNAYLATASYFYANSFSYFSGDTRFYANVTVFANTTLNAQTAFNNSVSVNGNSNFTGISTFYAPVTLNHTTSLVGNSTFSSSATFNGLSTFNSTSTFNGISNFNQAVNLGSSAPLSSSSTISDNKGNVRRVPETFTSTPYTLQASDSGKVVRTVNQQITVPSGVFNNGDTVTILNWSGTPTTIVKGAGLATMYWSGNNSEGNRTIGWLGLCTILFVASNECVISGSGLT